MKKPFQVDDRVRVYYTSSPSAATGRICSIAKDGFLIVKFPENVHHTVNPKCCRRLVKKKRKTWWIHNSLFTATARQLDQVFILSIKPSDPENWTEVKEVMRKK